MISGKQAVNKLWPREGKKEFVGGNYFHDHEDVLKYDGGNGTK